MAHVVCLLNVQADRASFTWSEGPASFKPYEIRGMDFEDCVDFAQQTRESLSNMVKDYLDAPDNLPQSCFELAKAGHELYQQIFRPVPEQQHIAKQVRDWLEGLRETHNIDTLEIVVDESPWAVAWNTLYDEPPDKEAFLSDEEKPDRWRPFWGIRYDLTAGRRVNPLRRLPLLVDPDVLLVVDPGIRDALPEDQQNLLAEFAETHQLTMVGSKDELVAAIKAERPELVYWLSHATPEALVLGGEEITPRLLRRLLRQDDGDGECSFGGLAFLNACQTAESAAAGSFLDALYSVGFSGMVGTEHQTVDTFANPLGLDFLAEFLVNREPIGKVMRRLRSRVPLGLLYGTYCPPVIRIKQSEDDPDDDVSGIDVVAMPRVKGDALAATVAEVRQLPLLPDEPYPSLDYYGYADRALFAGRDEDVQRFASYLDDAQTRILVLHGESGVGKSSFLRAGVIPYLEEDCVGYRFARRRLEWEGQTNDEESIVVIRATSDPFGQLGQALCACCAQPYSYQTPLGQVVKVDLPAVLSDMIGKSPDPAMVREALRNDLSLLGRLLGTISDKLPHAAVLVIDQCEEVFTLAESPEDAETRDLALAMLRRTTSVKGNFKIILSLRTEYYGRLIDRLRRGLQDIGGIREYLLTDFDEAALVEAIARPTAAHEIRDSAEIPFQKYSFEYDQGVPEEIARQVAWYTTHRRDSVLPLVQVICTQLYELARARTDRKITRDDLHQLGSVEGAMRRHVEGLMGGLLKQSSGDRNALKALFTQLFIRQPDGSLTTALLPEDEVERRWHGRLPFQQLLESAERTRLLRVNSLRIGGGDERRYVSLGHDALAKLAAEWEEKLSRAKWRKKMLVTTGLVAFVALAMSFLFVSARVAENKARRAEQDAKLAVQQAVYAGNEFFMAISENELLNQPGMQPLQLALVEKAHLHFQELLKYRGNDPDLLEEIARAHYGMGFYRDIVESVEGALESFENARSSFETLLAKRPKDFKLLQSLGDTYNAIGKLQTRQGRYALAIKAYEKALNVREQLVDVKPGHGELQRKRANVYMNMAQVKGKRQDIPGAIADHHIAQTIRHELLKSKADPEWVAANLPLDYRILVVRDLAQGYYNLGIIHNGQKNYQKAIEHLQAACDMARQVCDADTRDLNNQRLLGVALTQLGGAIKRNQEYAQRFQQAQGDFDEALGVLLPLALSNPDVEQYQADLASVYGAIASLRYDQGKLRHLKERYEEAFSYRQQQEKILEQLAKRQLAELTYHKALGAARLAILYVLNDGQLDRAQFDSRKKQLEKYLDDCKERFKEGIDGLLRQFEMQVGKWDAERREGS